MKTAHHGERLGKAPGQIQFAPLRAEQADQFVVDYFNDLLARLDAGDDLFAERLFLDATDDLFGDLEVDVGIEQCHANLAQRLGNVALGDLPETAQVLESFLKFFTEGVKHGRRR